MLVKAAYLGFHVTCIEFETLIRLILKDASSVSSVSSNHPQAFAQTPIKKLKIRFGRK